MRRYSISFHQGRQVSRDHNRREENAIKHQEHIFKGGNFEVWRDEAIEAAFDRIFGDEIARYNSEQGRKKLKIDNYFQYVSKKKQVSPAYEIIVAVGNRRSKPEGETCKAVLKEYVDSFQERNPSLIVIGAYYHADEYDPKTGIFGTPHVHLDYIPVATGYKTGLRMRVSRHRAIENQVLQSGSKGGTSLFAWQQTEREELIKICRQHAITITTKKEGKREHLDTDLYKVMKEIERLEDEIAKLEEKKYQQELSIAVNAAEIDRQENIINKSSQVNKQLEEVWHTKGMTVMPDATFQFLKLLAEKYEEEHKEKTEKEKIIQKIKEEIRYLSEENSFLNAFKNYICERYPGVSYEASLNCDYNGAIVDVDFEDQMINDK